MTSARGGLGHLAAGFPEYKSGLLLGTPRARYLSPLSLSSSMSYEPGRRLMLSLSRCKTQSLKGSSRAMIIDIHGHYTTAPVQLDAWRKAQVESAGRPFNQPLAMSDDEIGVTIQNGQLK